MYDNGLLNYYKTAYFRDGFLNAKSFGIKNEPSFFNSSDTTAKCSLNSLKFYKKLHHYFSKEMADAEILLSQIYCRVGLKSAVYTPAEEGGSKFLLCNDVQKEDTVSAVKFHKDMMEKEGCTEGDLSSMFSHSNPFGKKLLNYFTRKANIEKLKMRLFDVASFNDDRLDCNFMYQIDNGGKVDSVLVYDHERGGLAVNCLLRSGFLEQTFVHDFGGSKTRCDMVDEFKNNEIVNEIISPAALAEEIGGINVGEVALDVSRNTGYVVEKSYVDTLSKSYHQVACMLQG